eukprot:2528092-Prymnesium_polylepis.1
MSKHGRRQGSPLFVCLCFGNGAGATQQPGADFLHESCVVHGLHTPDAQRLRRLAESLSRGQRSPSLLLVKASLDDSRVVQHDTGPVGPLPVAPGVHGGVREGGRVQPTVREVGLHDAHALLACTTRQPNRKNAHGGAWQHDRAAKGVHCRQQVILRCLHAQSGGGRLELGGGGTAEHLPRPRARGDLDKQVVAVVIKCVGVSVWHPDSVHVDAGETPLIGCRQAEFVFCVKVDQIHSTSHRPGLNAPGGRGPVRLSRVSHRQQRLPQHLDARCGVCELLQARRLLHPPAHGLPCAHGGPVECVRRHLVPGQRVEPHGPVDRVAESCTSGGKNCQVLHRVCVSTSRAAAAVDASAGGHFHRYQSQRVRSHVRQRALLRTLVNRFLEFLDPCAFAGTLHGLWTFKSG